MKFPVQFLSDGRFRSLFGRLDESDGGWFMDWYGRFKRQYRLFSSEKTLGRRIVERYAAANPRLKPEIDELARKGGEIFPDDVMRDEDVAENAAAVLAPLFGGAKDRFAFAGYGMFKFVFVTDDGHALKLAIDDPMRSMFEEVGLAKKWKNLSCFPKLYDAADDCSSYVCECARRVRDSDFGILGVDGPDSLVGMLRDGGLASRLGTDEPKWRSIRDLLRFMRDERWLVDINESRNWGMVSRDGKPALVVVDFDR